MNSEDDRPLTDKETKILLKLLEAEFPGCDQLLLQAQGVSATDTGDTDNYGSIYLHTNVANKAGVVQRIPVEGKILDKDGVPISILLHVVNGYMNELEIFKTDGSDILDEIKAENISVIVNGGS